MTLSKFEADAIRVIVNLPDDDWSDTELDAFHVARGRLSAALERHDRIQARKPGVGSRKGAVRKESAELRMARPIVYKRSGGYCEANTPACPAGTHNADHVHHIAGKRNEAPGDLLHVCFDAHRYIHDHPEESYGKGWMKKRLGAWS